MKHMTGKTVLITGGTGGTGGIGKAAAIDLASMGLQRMISDDKYCIDVLTQVNAVSAALKGVAVGLLDEHVRHCVREAAEAGDEGRADEMVTEATKAIERLVRS